MFQNFFIWEGDMEAAGVSACGMFTPTHIIVTILCLAVMLFFVFRSRGLSEERLNRIVLYIAIPVTVLECCKIGFNWAHGGLTPNHWLPLTFCSFSIYAYWLVACGKGVLHEIGKGYLVGGGIIAGLSFLLIPMTSVATYPMLHFLSCYSMLFHSLMMYTGLSYLINGYFRFDIKNGYRRYLLFCGPACGLALVVNLIYACFDDIANCNMMFLSDPYRLDFVPFIHAIYGASPALYTIGVLVVYLTVPYFVPYGIVRLVNAIRGKRSSVTPEEEKEPEEVTV